MAGIWSVSFAHSAEARGIPTYWKNADGTIKAQYFKDLSQPRVAQHKEFPIVVGKTKIEQQRERQMISSNFR